MDLEKLFEQISSDVLTEDVKIQLSTIFEARLNDAIEAKEAVLEESNRKEITGFKDDLVNQIDEYLHYFCEEYIKENRQSIVESTKVKTAAKVLEKFSKMVDEFNVALSPVNENAVREQARIKSLQTELNGRVNESIKQREKINDLKRKLMIAEKSGMLTTDSERARFEKLAESVKFEDETTFVKKLNVVINMLRANAPARKGVVRMAESKVTKKVEKRVISEERTKIQDSGMTSYLDMV